MGRGKKILVIGLIFSFAIAFAGCTTEKQNNTETISEQDSHVGTETDKENKNTVKEVVFFNYPQETGYSNGVNEGWSNLWYETVHPYLNPYAYDVADETLYALHLSVSYYDESADGILPEDYPVREESEDEAEYTNRLGAYMSEKVKAIMKSEGIVFLAEASNEYSEEYMYDCTIIANSKDLFRIFDDEEHEINNWGYILKPAVRSDFIEIIKSLGWEGTGSADEWALHNIDLVQSVVGEEPHVTMSVEVE